ncbi:hypothetical protein QUV59_22430, partial [Xanthomonas citri pv. citri]
IVVPKGFEEAAGSFFSGGALELETIVDPSRKAEAGMLEGKLNQYGFRVLGTALTDTTRTKKLVGDARTQVAQAKDLNPVQKLAISTLLSSVESLTESGVNIAGNAQTGEGESASPLAGWSPVRVTTRELAASDDKKRPTSSWQVSMPQ